MLFFLLFFVLLRRPPRTTRTVTLFPYSPLFRSYVPILPGRPAIDVRLEFRLALADQHDILRSAGDIQHVDIDASHRLLERTDRVLAIILRTEQPRFLGRHRNERQRTPSRSRHGIDRKSTRLNSSH